MVDGGRLGVGELGGELVEPHVVGMHQRVDVAEGEQVVLGLQPEHVEHGLRPEDAAARQVPVPQAAAPAIERGVDAAAHRLVDRVGFAGACRLPMEGEAEDEDDEAGGGGQGDGEGGERTPGAERRVARLYRGDGAEWRLQRAHGREDVGIIGQRDLHDAGAGAEGGERLCRAQHIDQPVPDGGLGAGRRRRNDAVRIGEQEVAAGGCRPAGQRARQNLLGLRRRLGGVLLDPLGGEIGDGIQRERHVAQGLPTMVEELDDGPDADGGEEGDDEDRDGAAEQGLCRQEAPIGRLGNRLRKPFDRIRMCRRTRHTGARH